MILSLVTGTLNRPHEFERLIASIQANTPIPHEVIVADASDDPVYTDGLPDNVVVLRERPRLGHAAGYNKAFREAKGEWVLWLNDDAEVLPGYAESAIRFMEEHPHIGLGALYYREGLRDFSVSSYFGMVYANFGIMRRDFGNQIGWFDEDLPMYGSDNAMAFNVLLAGKGVAGIPDARVIHYATLDAHRLEHGDYTRRQRDAETLAAKYGPRMAEIKAVYAQTSNAESVATDQTPQWMKDRVGA